MLKKHSFFSIRAFLLVLVYLIGTSKGLLFHQHEGNKVVWDKANSCEKTIYFSGEKAACQHTGHFILSGKKCNACESHNVVPHLVTYCYFIENPNFPHTNLASYLSGSLYVFPVSVRQRGPPAI